MMATFEEGLPRLAEISGVSEDDLRTMQAYSQATQGLRDKAANLQMGIEQEQYNEQLRISRRGLGDLVGLAGKMSASYGGITEAATQYGQLQRAQIMDARQLSQIQLARSQRELNLSIAISRLQAPGETAEERAVRRREAEMLAAEQQRELDINKRSTQRGFTIQDIDIGRQLQDALRAQNLTEAQRTISFKVTGLNTWATMREQAQQVKFSLLDIGTQFGEQTKQAMNTAQAQAEAASGQFLKLQATQTRKVFEDIIDNVEKAYDTVIPTYKTRGERREEREQASGMHQDENNGRLGGRAAGGVFSASGATSFIAGEAGPESVVVIRNPKLGMTSGGSAPSGGSNSNVTININASVRDDRDVDSLVKKVVREIHHQASLVV